MRPEQLGAASRGDPKSTRLNSSHLVISYAVFCLKKKKTVTFGNGSRGDRLPTVVENVRATYRAGIGRPGNVRAGQITQLQTQPLCVNGVTNPLPSTGGADRDTLDQARR